MASSFKLPNLQRVVTKWRRERERTRKLKPVISKSPVKLQRIGGSPPEREQA